MNIRLLKILTGSLLAAATAGACSVPVFRFGLDRWQSEAYGLIAAEDWKNGDGGKKFAEALDI